MNRPWPPSGVQEPEPYKGHLFRRNLSRLHGGFQAETVDSTGLPGCPHQPWGQLPQLSPKTVENEVSPPSLSLPPQALQAWALYNRHFISSWNAVTRRSVCVQNGWEDWQQA